MSVAYEWDVEETAACDSEQYEQGEIIEHYHCGSYREALAFSKAAAPAGSRWEIVLVRDDDDRRAWAYMGSDTELPEFFCDADGREYRKVPARFHKEVARLTQ